jgi:hypothetical protein
MHPNTPNVRMVDNFGGYTAAAGHAFMVSDALPARLQGKALVTEPTAKLIGIMDIQPDGAGYKAGDGGNLLASTDEWMSPIFADVGPDGAIWVIDFYSFIIQHNPTPSLSRPASATTGRGGAYKTENDLRDPTTGASTGWCGRTVEESHPITWQGESPTGSRRSTAATSSGLAAQRLLVDNRMTNAAPARKRVRSGAGGKGRSTHSGRSKDRRPRRNAPGGVLNRMRPCAETPFGAAGERPDASCSSQSCHQDPDLLTRQAPS